MPAFHAGCETNGTKPCTELHLEPTDSQRFNALGKVMAALVRSGDHSGVGQFCVYLLACIYSKRYTAERRASGNLLPIAKQQMLEHQGIALCSGANMPLRRPLV